jgi:hypothetical protein
MMITNGGRNYNQETAGSRRHEEYIKQQKLQLAEQAIQD